MSKLSDVTKLLKRSFPNDALVECAKAFQAIGESLDNLIPLDALEKLAEYDAIDLAEMHLGVLEAENIVKPRQKPLSGFIVTDSPQSH